VFAAFLETSKVFDKSNHKLMVYTHHLSIMCICV